METPDYPKNNRFEEENDSKKERESKQDKNIKRVVNGKVVRKRKVNGGFADASQDILGYVARDIFMPYIKDMVSDAIVQSTDRLLFGESRGNRPANRRTARANGSTGHISYNRYSKPVTNQPSTPRPNISNQARARHQFDSIILASRTEADEVIDRLYDLLGMYDSVTVSDFYEMLGIAPKYTDENWGWTDLHGASVRRVRNGFMLVLPEPIFFN